MRYLGWPMKKIVLFRCDWFESSHSGIKVDHQDNIMKLIIHGNTEVMILLSLHKMSNKCITLHNDCVETKLIGGLL